MTIDGFKAEHQNAIVAFGSDTTRRLSQGVGWLSKTFTSTVAPGSSPAHGTTIFTGLPTRG